MCLLIHRLPEAKAINDAWIDDFWEYNSDGFGAWWIGIDRLGRSTVHVAKTMDKAEAKQIIRQIEAADIEAGMHFRWATHGKVGLRNCHPFTVREEGDRVISVMGHNGVLGAFAPTAGKAAETSDTEEFIHRLLRPMIAAKGLKPLFRAKSTMRESIETVCGGSNKLLLTDHKSGFSQFGKVWTEWNGLKLSNTYAWSYSQRDKDAPTKPKYNYRGGWSMWDDDGPIFRANSASDEVFIGVSGTEWAKCADGVWRPKTGMNTHPESTTNDILAKSEITGDYVTEAIETLAYMTPIQIEEWVRDEPDVAAAVIAELVA